jgi:hypothetical protein
MNGKNYVPYFLDKKSHDSLNKCFIFDKTIIITLLDPIGNK